jgi:hypothetical protein
MKDLIKKILREQSDSQDKITWSKEKVQSIANQYEYLDQFRKEEPKAFRAARKRGWFDEVTKNLKRKNKQWSKEEVLNLASKYELMSDFKKDNLNAYQAATHNGWLPELSNYLKIIPKDWDKDLIINTAKKYEHMNDFKQNHPKEYVRARTLKILPIIRDFMKPQLINWTFDMVKDRAINYTKLDDFRNNEKKAYSAAITKGWIDDIKKMFTDYNILWTKDMAIDLAKRYNNRNEFRLNHPKAYKAVITNKWGDEAFKDMQYLGNMYSRAVYSFEFPDKTAYVGLTLNIDKRKIQHIHKTSNSPVAKYRNLTGQEPIFKIISNGYVESSEAQNIENCTINDYKLRGWKVLNKAKAGGLGCVRIIWTKEKVLSILPQYNSYLDFKKYNSGAYQSSLKRGFNQDVKDFYGYQGRNKK